VQFTADQEYIDLVEQARALSWHTLPHGDLAELHRLAMQMLVDKLLRRKAAVSRPEPTVAATSTGEGADAPTSSSQLLTSRSSQGESPSPTAHAPARSVPTSRLLHPESPSAATGATTERRSTIVRP